MWPNIPRALGRNPVERRAAGTGLSARAPETTAYSNNPRTAAMRRFIVAGAGPRRADRRTTFWPTLLAALACQSK